MHSLYIRNCFKFDKFCTYYKSVCLVTIDMVTDKFYIQSIPITQWCFELFISYMLLTNECNCKLFIIHKMLSYAIKELNSIIKPIGNISWINFQRFSLSLLVLHIEIILCNQSHIIPKRNVFWIMYLCLIHKSTYIYTNVNLNIKTKPIFWWNTPAYYICRALCLPLYKISL